LPFSLFNLDVQRGWDRLSQFVLDGEDVDKVEVVFFRPDVFA
jgi:hypothetical protein